MAQDLRLDYFNPSLLVDTTTFAVPIETNVAIALMLGERMTLPWSSGYVDSISIVLDSALGDSIDVGLVADTFFNGFHRMNGDQNFVGFGQSTMRWDSTLFQSAVYWNGALFIPSIKLHEPTVVAVPHVSVPANFYVAVIPRIANSGGQNNITSGFIVEGDTEAHFVRTADNTRSAYLAYDQALQQNESGPLDSAVDLSSAPYYGDGLYTNLNIAAYVSQSSSSVPTIQLAGKSITFFPNPASNEITLEAPEELLPSKIEILDLLGRTVLSSPLERRHSFDVSHLAPGRYEALIKTAVGIRSTQVIIQR